ncbi:MAG TPA: CDP-alcohol phosphatidyltransferase family protein [Anaerolineales bacterium]|nr:CDP-alcohol phosphatidyltransferase family protein [Anaerolineales bacterium]
MISQWVRTWYSKVVDPFLAVLARLDVTANMLTLASMLIIMMAGVLLAVGKPILGACVLMFGAFLDGIDGELARVSGVKSSFGGFLDSICDHIGDFTIYLGLLIPYLQKNAFVEIILIFVAMFASVFGSHVRSRAGVVAIDTKTIGIFTRFERIFLLFICILIGKVIIALWGLAIFNSFSALQRVIYTMQAYRKQNITVQSAETL